MEVSAMVKKKSPRGARNTHKRSLTRSGKPAPTFDRDGKQMLVPGVAPATTLPDDDERTVQTIVMTKGRMRAQRVAAVAAGFKAWTHWALATLDRAAGLEPMAVR
jgi:hypothetical protein